MFPIALAGITVVELRGGRPILRATNLTEHLAPLLDERAQEAADRRARSGALCDGGALTRGPYRRRRLGRRRTRRSSETRSRRVAARTSCIRDSSIGRWA